MESFPETQPSACLLSRCGKHLLSGRWVGRIIWPLRAMAPIALKIHLVFWDSCAGTVRVGLSVSWVEAQWAATTTSLHPTHLLTSTLTAGGLFALPGECSEAHFLLCSGCWFLMPVAQTPIGFLQVQSLQARGAGV